MHTFVKKTFRYGLQVYFYSTSRGTWSMTDPLQFESKFIQYGTYAWKYKYCYVFINFNTIQIYAFDYVNIGELGLRWTPYGLRANFFNMVIMLGKINTAMFSTTLISYKYMHLIM